MRSTDEQLREIVKRADHVRDTRKARRHLQLSALASFVCAVLLTAVAFYLPRMNSVTQDSGMTRYGSLLLGAPYVGYVAIAVLAFALGICVTLLCIRIKEPKEKEHERK